MTSVTAPPCISCKHYKDEWRRNVPTCAAFPAGIPQAIFFDREDDHVKPYPGDNGIRFEQATDKPEFIAG